ncbi:MAG TPA: DoxX family protein [Acidobacteriaceae bacterium]|jgi:putative oxidoreductase|nr:DoxX family protein [Acidobacteriaceae bacterium]
MAAEQHWYAKMNDEFSQMARWLQSPFLLAVRLYWGWQFMQTGWGKLHNLAQVTGFFTSLGIPSPGPMAHMCANLEFFGGLLLILGLASRFVSLLLVCNMFVAYYTADREALFSIFSDPGKFYTADPYTFLFAALIILIFGAGAISVDHLMRHHFEKKRLERLAKLEAAS